MSISFPQSLPDQGRDPGSPSGGALVPALSWSPFSWQEKLSEAVLGHTTVCVRASFSSIRAFVRKEGRKGLLLLLNSDESGSFLSQRPNITRQRTEDATDKLQKAYFSDEKGEFLAAEACSRRG